MSDLQALRRVAIGGVVLAVVVGVVSLALSFAAVGDLEALAFGHVDTILRAGPQAAPLWRWAMLTDMFNSYLLLAPLALYCHRLLRERRPWLADLGLVRHARRCDHRRLPEPALRLAAVARRAPMAGPSRNR